MTRTLEKTGDAVRTGLRMAVLACLCALGAALPQAALAQFSDSYKFLEAVRKSDTTAIAEFVDQPGVTLVNTKDRTTGETALHITVGRRDFTMTNYLLGHGARPDLTDKEGRSPLMIAVERRFIEGAQLLLSKKADPDQANSRGETPLMRAVQLNDLDLARLLLGQGADPDRRDSLAGMSSIDYARRSNRGTAMLDLLTTERKKPRSKAVQGPQL